MEHRVARLTGLIRNENGEIINPVQEEEDGRRVYVGGMPFWYDVDTIKEYWEYCGEVEDVDLMTFPDTGNFRGIAFITFKTRDGAKEAMQYDGNDCDGRTLKVRPSTCCLFRHYNYEQASRVEINR